MIVRHTGRTDVSEWEGFVKLIEWLIGLAFACFLLYIPIHFIIKYW